MESRIGFWGLLTIALIVLKLLGFIASWWTVFLVWVAPVTILIFVYLLIFAVTVFVKK